LEDICEQQNSLQLLLVLRVFSLLASELENGVLKATAYKVKKPKEKTLFESTEELSPEKTLMQSDHIEDEEITEAFLEGGTWEFLRRLNSAEFFGWDSMITEAERELFLKIFPPKFHVCAYHNNSYACKTHLLFSSIISKHI
jgi:hypothetical protein